jgi:hypothetical protein
MRYGAVLTGIVLALAGGGTAAAGPNVALSSDGASFVSASSALNPALYGLTPINGGQATADANLLTTTPTVWLSDNDTRYLFSDTDTNESVIISLGSEQSLQSFGATWYTAQYQDRAPTSFAVLVSTNGTNFTLEGSVASLSSGGGADLLSLAVPVDALYVEYEFGGSGTGIDELFASVPEPAAAALLLTGLASLTVLRRRRPSKTV